MAAFLETVLDRRRIQTSLRVFKIVTADDERRIHVKVIHEKHGQRALHQLEQDKGGSKTARS